MIWILFFSFYAQASLNRLDPHGVANTDINSATAFKSECSVCHLQVKTEIKLKPTVVETCTTCHNKSPHSGVPEHLGRIFFNSQSNQREPITCLACHSPHRFGSLNNTAESGLIHFSKVIIEPLIKKKSEFPMLKRRCDECHKW